MLSWGLYVEQAGDVQLQMNETLSCSGASEEKELAERERERGSLGKEAAAVLRGQGRESLDDFWASPR